MLCFEFLVKVVLVAQQCFGCSWTELHSVRFSVSHSAHPRRRPGRCCVPSNIILSNSNCVLRLILYWSAVEGGDGQWLSFISLVCLLIVSSLSLTNANIFVRNYKFFSLLLFWFSPPSTWSGTESVSGLVFSCCLGAYPTHLSKNVYWTRKCSFSHLFGEKNRLVLVAFDRISFELRVWVKECLSKFMIMNAHVHVLANQPIFS